MKPTPNIIKQICKLEGLNRIKIATAYLVSGKRPASDCAIYGAVQTFLGVDLITRWYTVLPGENWL